MSRHCCCEADAHEARIREDFRSGARSGVNGTPSFFINGARYDGMVEVEELLVALTGEPGSFKRDATDGFEF